MEWMFFLIFTFTFYTKVQRGTYYDREIIFCAIGSFVFSVLLQSITKGTIDELVEESVKFVFLAIFLKNTDGLWRNKLKSGALLGLTFATIENFFIILAGGSLYTLFYRFLLTTTMHMCVGTLMGYYFIKNNKVKALVIPFVIHFAFNSLVYKGNLAYLFMFMIFIKLITNGIKQKAPYEEYDYHMNGSPRYMFLMKNY